MSEGTVWMEHPDAPVERRLTNKQFQLLDAVCRSNGGGVTIHDWPKSTIKGLMDRHLVQGKAGHPYRFVHTADGLRMWRKLRPATPPAQKEDLE